MTKKLTKEARAVRTSKGKALDKALKFYGILRMDYEKDEEFRERGIEIIKSVDNWR